MQMESYRQGQVKKKSLQYGMVDAAPLVWTLYSILINIEFVEHELSIKIGPFLSILDGSLPATCFLSLVVWPKQAEIWNVIFRPQ